MKPFMWSLAVATTLFLFPSAASAKIAYLSDREMIQKSGIIAVVDVAEPVEERIQSGGKNYSHIAKAKVVQSVKGYARGEIKLLSGQFLGCAYCYWKPGRYLVFLSWSPNGWTGTNGELSQWKVEGDRVIWKKDKKDAGFSDRALRPLSVVVAELGEEMTVGAVKKP